MLAMICAAPASAQIDFEIPSNTRNLSAEYKKELEKWTLQAYEGDRDAQFKVGVLSTNQQFREPDYEQAVYWYKQAARQGHVLAQYNLGHQYLTGVGVEKSETTAMQWWLKAAEQDHALAQFNLGRAYYLGIGVPVDLAKSRRWFEKAAQNNEPKSIDILEQLGWAEPGQYQPKVESTNNPATTPEQPEQSNQTSIASFDAALVESSAQITSKIVPIETDPAPAKSAPDNDTEISADAEEPEAEPVATTVQPAATTADEADALAESPADEPMSEVTSDESDRSTTPESDTGSTTQDDATTTVDRSIAVYTNPAVRSVLVAIVENGDQLKIVSSKGKWTQVTSSKGVPVWVHGNFVTVANDIGTIRGTSVNARSVPLVTTGTVVGQFDDGETVEVLGKRDVWYRVMSPPRFAVWVRTDDLRAAIRTQDPAVKLLAPVNEVSGEPVRSPSLSNHYSS